ncbi:MAG: hypothetical protein Q7R89_00305 [bacterium]|nr:hypothetical protein [bacterium]
MAFSVIVSDWDGNHRVKKIYLERMSSKRLLARLVEEAGLMAYYGDSVRKSFPTLTTASTDYRNHRNLVNAIKREILKRLTSKSKPK